MNSRKRIILNLDLVLSITPKFNIVWSNHVYIIFVQLIFYEKVFPPDLLRVLKWRSRFVLNCLHGAGSRYVLNRVHGAGSRCVLNRVHGAGSRYVLNRVHGAGSRYVLNRVHGAGSRCVLNCQHRAGSVCVELSTWSRIRLC